MVTVMLVSLKDNNVQPQVDERVERLLALLTYVEQDYPFKDFVKQEMAGFKVAASFAKDLEVLESSGSDAKERADKENCEAKLTTMLASARQLMKQHNSLTELLKGELAAAVAELNPTEYTMNGLFQGVLQNENFLDVITLVASKYTETAKEYQRKIGAACKNLHREENSWKKRVGEEQDVKVLIQAAMGDMARINAVALEETLEGSLEENRVVVLGR